eukprot:TRINITY_DN10029_c0_g1_i1.p1 TRINITY_DN10029_c0_g1~~TRINITY_DN10029_c0_g1_i1.p1  ORF type:complete len:357 (-),score=62.13 TRINITY_DN10029_c0_g1_i1:24-1094(-)
MAAISEKPHIIEHATKSFACTVFETRWIPQSARFVALGEYARGTGMFQIHGLSHGKIEQLKEGEKRSPFRCATFNASTAEERHLATGDFEGQLMYWDIEHIEAPLWHTKAHQSMISCVDGCGGLTGGGAPELVTGSRDGLVKVWDTRQHEVPVAQLQPTEGSARDCWAVCFGNNSGADRVVAAGYDNGDIKLLDLRTGTLRWETNVKNGVVSLQFDRPDIEMNKLVVTMLESRFNVYDMRTFHPERGYNSLTQRAHDSTVWHARHLPQNREIWMTTGGNGTLCLWKYSYPPQRWRSVDDGKAKEGVLGTAEQLNIATVSTQPIVSFDWSRDKEGLAVMAALDQTVRVVICTKLNTV